MDWQAQRAHGLQDLILLNYARIENAHKLRKKTFDFLLCIGVQQIFSFPFSLLRRYQMLNAFMVTTAIYELGQQYYHAAEIGNVPNAVSTCATQSEQTK